MKYELNEKGVYNFALNEIDLSDETIMDRIEAVIGDKRAYSFTLVGHSGDTSCLIAEPFPPIEDTITELQEYIGMDYSEQSETCNELINLYYSNGDYRSDDFKQALVYEINMQLDFYKKNSRVVIEEEVIPERTIESKTLEWV